MTIVSARRPMAGLLASFLVLLLLVGCGGGGGQPVSSPVGSGPEAALRQTLAGWNSTGGPSLGIGADGHPVATFRASEPYGYIVFRDMANGGWNLRVDEIIYLSDSLAEIHTSYAFDTLASGSVQIIFTMTRTTDGWGLDDVEVVNLPVAVVSTGIGVEGFVVDQTTNAPLEGADVSLWSGTTLVATTKSGANGYYSITGVPAGTYTLTVVGSGYVLQTIPDLTI